MWAWLKTKYLRNTAGFGNFYTDEDNRDKLWMTGTNNEDLIEALLPRLLALPTFVTEFLGQQGGACLPHKLRKLVSEHINGGELQVWPAKWQL